MTCRNNVFFFLIDENKFIIEEQKTEIAKFSQKKNFSIRIFFSFCIQQCYHKCRVSCDFNRIKLFQSICKFQVQEKLTIVKN